MESSGSRRYSGKLFQIVGSTTANERGPYVDNLTGGTIISWLLCDDRSWYLDGLSFTGKHSSELEEQHPMREALIECSL